MLIAACRSWYPKDSMDDVAHRLRRFAAALAGREAALPSGMEAGDFAQGARALIAAAGGGEAPAAPADDCLARIFAGVHRLTVSDRALLVLWAVERMPAEDLAAVVGHPAGLVLGRAAEIAADLYAHAMEKGAGCRILVAEDERITALELKEALEEMGHAVPWVAVSAG